MPVAMEHVKTSETIEIQVRDEMRLAHVCFCFHRRLGDRPEDEWQAELLRELVDREASGLRTWRSDATRSR